MTPKFETYQRAGEMQRTRSARRRRGPFPRALCSRCGKSTPINADGTMRRHTEKDSMVLCPGSGDPIDAAQATDALTAAIRSGR